MKWFAVVFLALLLLSGAYGVAAQGSQGYVPFTETITFDPTTGGWKSTGIIVKGGISISATGEVTCDAYADDGIWWNCFPRGPEGLGPLGLYSLAGSIGGGPAFPITSETQVFTGDGELKLLYFDNLHWDNGGEYYVTVSSCRPGNGYGDTNNCHFGAPDQN